MSPTYLCIIRKLLITCVDVLHSEATERYVDPHVTTIVPFWTLTGLLVYYYTLPGLPGYLVVLLLPTLQFFSTYNGRKHHKPVENADFYYFSHCGLWRACGGAA